MNSVNWRKIIGSIVLYLGLFIAFMLILWPLWYLVTVSFQTEQAIFKDPGWFPSIKNLTLQNYVDVLLHYEYQQQKFIRFVMNSVITSVGSTAIAVVFGMFAAYGISRFNFRGRKLFVAAIVTTQLLPVVVFLLPYYTVMNVLGLRDTLMSLIISYLAFALPVATWLLTGFMNELPTDIDSAAIIDGCSFPGILIRIILPMVAPGVASVSLFAFILGWNDYLFASVLLRSTFTLPVALHAFIGQYLIHWGAILAGGVIVSLPVVTAFMYLQRHVVKGLSAGSVKG